MLQMDAANGMRRHLNGDKREAASEAVELQIQISAQGVMDCPWHSVVQPLRSDQAAPTPPFYCLEKGKMPDAVEVKAGMEEKRRLLGGSQTARAEVLQRVRDAKKCLNHRLHHDSDESGLFSVSRRIITRKVHWPDHETSHLVMTLWSVVPVACRRA